MKNVLSNKSSEDTLRKEADIATQCVSITNHVSNSMDNPKDLI